MPWYGWAGWIVLLLVAIGILIYFLVRKKPEGMAGIEKQLTDSEAALKAARAQVDSEIAARKAAEAERAKQELALLEQTNRDRLTALSEKEKTDYEAAKADPQSGVDYIRDLLGLGKPSGGPT